MTHFKRNRPKSERSKNAWMKEANGKGRGDHVPERQAAKAEIAKESFFSRWEKVIKQIRLN